MLVLLGDYLYHGPRNPLPSSYGPPSVVSVFADFDTPIVAVRGNCDAEVDLYAASVRGGRQRRDSR